MSVSLENFKLGKVYNWSLPAGPWPCKLWPHLSPVEAIEYIADFNQHYGTCLGHTTLCYDSEICYALGGCFRFSPARKSYLENYIASLEAAWSEQMAAALRELDCGLFRLHVSGDFYNREYIQNWIRIVREVPQTKFWCYTRSWRCPDLLPDLLQLAAEPNFCMWFSCDRESGVPPKRNGIGAAYMSLDDDDMPPADVDLVFRVKRDTEKEVYETADGTLVPVCTNERTIKKRNQKREEDCDHITCSECQHCVQPQRHQYEVPTETSETPGGDCNMERETVLPELDRGVGEDDGLYVRSGVQPGLPCASASGDGDCGSCRATGCGALAHDTGADQQSESEGSGDVSVEPSTIERIASTQFAYDSDEQLVDVYSSLCRFMELPPIMPDSLTCLCTADPVETTTEPSETYAEAPAVAGQPEVAENVVAETAPTQLDFTRAPDCEWALVSDTVAVSDSIVTRLSAMNTDRLVILQSVVSSPTGSIATSLVPVYGMQVEVNWDGKARIVDVLPELKSHWSE